MAFHRFQNALIGAALVIGMASCGGGAQLAGGGIGGTGISQGPITGFGSIFVNGVEYDTTNATIVKDGAPVRQADLQVGMVVTVNGSIDSTAKGAANTVTYTKELEGPITALTANTLTVLGQTVIVDNLTKIVIAGSPAPALSDLNSNDTVEVSGLPSGSGLRATYIEKKPPSANVELKGFITAINGTALIIGTQIVDVSAAAPSFTPAVGNYVAVKGTLVGNRVAASSLELKSRVLDGSRDKAELQGYVTATGAGGDFTLGSQPVHSDARTRFIGGAAADIKAGLKLKAEGPLVNGVLNATLINFEDGLELAGNIATLDSANRILTLDSYPHIDISYDATLTEAEEGTDLNALAKDQRIKVRGRKLDGNCANTTCMLATQLTLESGNPGAGSTALLQGSVESFSNPFITVLGVTVDTSAISTFGGDGITKRSDFFAKVRVGSLVKIDGTRDAQGAVSWQSIDLDD